VVRLTRLRAEMEHDLAAMMARAGEIDDLLDRLSVVHGSIAEALIRLHGHVVATLAEVGR